MESLGGGALLGEYVAGGMSPLRSWRPAPLPILPLTCWWKGHQPVSCSGYHASPNCCCAFPTVMGFILLEPWARTHPSLSLLLSTCFTIATEKQLEHWYLLVHRQIQHTDFNIHFVGCCSLCHRTCLFIGFFLSFLFWWWIFNPGPCIC